MSHDDDLDDVLHRLISDDHAGRILSGRPVDGDHPSYADLARLFADARGDQDHADQIDADQIDPAFVAQLAAVASTATAESPSRRNPVNKIVGGKLATLAAADSSEVTGVAVAAAMPEASNKAAVTVPANLSTPASPDAPARIARRRNRRRRPPRQRRR